MAIVELSGADFTPIHFEADPVLFLVGVDLGELGNLLALRLVGFALLCTT